MPSSTPDVEYTQVDVAPSIPARSSKPARQRHNARRPKKGGKPGNPGIFHGEREEYLHGFLPAFMRLPHRARGTQASDFWNPVFAGYWERFPWYYPRDEEPSTSTRTAPETMTPELTAQKGKIIERTQKVCIAYSPLTVSVLYSLIIAADRVPHALRAHVKNQSS